MNVTPAVRILRDRASLARAVEALRPAGPVALVPTMGALHDGHGALIAEGRTRAASVVVSIFVNPLQFGANEDFDRYPRTEAADARLAAAAGASLVFAPPANHLYPPGFATGLTVGPLGERLCGRHRPGHFDGMATVVVKLLALVRPDLALFGEKDWQQLVIIRQLVRDLELGVDIVGVPTVREADGLALSSRNRYLSPDERTTAALLPATLREGAGALAAGQPAADVLAAMKRSLEAAGFVVDYLELADGERLEPLARPAPGARLFAAARLGATRLIDHWPI